MIKKARLIFAQIDHVSGEVTGFAVGKIMELGAKNVQVLQTITKKNRPGNIMMIDTDPGHETEIANFLSKELKVSGYHRVNTSHIFQEVSFIRKKLNIKMNGKTQAVECEIKLIGNPTQPLSMDIEHDFLVKVQEIINSNSNSNSSVSLSELRTIIESRLQESCDEITIEIKA
ncbi:MAG: nickel insertion protein [Nitrospirota bacterium]